MEPRQEGRKAVLMKRSAKLFFTTLMATFLLAIFTTPAFAAINYPTKQTVYLQSAGGVGYANISVSGFAKGKGIVKSSVKSSNPSVATAHTLSKSSTEYQKLSKEGSSGSYYYDYIELGLKKAGTAKITYKVGSKACATTIVVKKYENPFKSLTITGVNGGKNLASKYKTTAFPMVKGGKKAGKIKVAAKAGWKVKSINYDNNTKYWSHNIYGNGAASATLSVPAKIGSGYLGVDFVNTKTGAMMHTSMILK